MKLKQWTELASVMGQLEGMALAMEWSEDIDLKKVKESLREIKGKVEEVFEAEREKLEDISYKPKTPAIPAKRKDTKKK